MYNTVFLGAPGAGKGTQAALVARDLGLEHVATGDLFRQAIGKQTELGKSVKKYLDKGELVPDGVTVKMVLERLSTVDEEQGVILDGFPRTTGQARALDDALRLEDKRINKVLYIKVPEEELVKRLSRRLVCRKCQPPYTSGAASDETVCERCGGELYQREDDNPETVKNRLKVYFEKTAPLVDYYRSSSRLVEVDGVGEMDNIAKKIVTLMRDSIAKTGK